MEPTKEDTRTEEEKRAYQERIDAAIKRHRETLDWLRDH